MATVINNPSTDSGGGGSMVFGAIFAIILIILFFVYGLPALRNNDRSGGTDIEVNLPENTPTPTSPAPSGQ